MKLCLHIEMDVSSSALGQAELGLTTIPTAMQIKLTEIFDSLFRNKKKFKVKHVIPLTYLWLGDEVDIFRTDNSPASKSICLYWPMGNAVVTFW